MSVVAEAAAGDFFDLLPGGCLPCFGSADDGLDEDEVPDEDDDAEDEEDDSLLSKLEFNLPRKLLYEECG